MLRLLILLFPCLIYSCRKDEAISDNSRSFYHNRVALSDTVFKLATYNIRFGFSPGDSPDNKDKTGAGREQVKKLVQAIRSSSANVVLLQEVGRNRCNTEIKDIVQAIADSLQMNYAFGSHGKGDACFPYKGEWGNATLSKFPIRTIETILVYRNGPYKRRSVLRTELQLNSSRVINIYNIHHPGENAEEVKNTGRFVSKSKYPAVAAGDFNRKYGDPELDAMGLHDCFSADLPGIDRVFCSADLKATGVGYLESSRNISDHLLYYAHFRFR